MALLPYPAIIDYFLTTRTTRKLTSIKELKLNWTVTDPNGWTSYGKYQGGGGYRSTISRKLDQAEWCTCIWECFHLTGSLEKKFKVCSKDILESSRVDAALPITRCILENKQVWKEIFNKKDQIVKKTVSRQWTTFLFYLIARWNSVSVRTA